jgi:EAL domain-containing protein (putative c-di-GMP-specific phosphodiesterase class I)
VGSDELLLPGEFLPAAERFDLIHVIDEWVINHAIELAVAGHSVTVNVSAKTFEITETAVADNLKAARTFATRLRQHGCTIALDDFGVGHGTFTYLRHLPVDYLKIDMQFVRNLLNDDEDRQIVLAIVGVARQFKIKTIAEGVEDQATLEELCRIGVDYVHGYWTGRPAPLPNAWMHPKSRRGDTRGTHGQ